MRPGMRTKAKSGAKEPKKLPSAWGAKPHPQSGALRKLATGSSKA